MQLWRRHPSALLWLIVTGGAGVYLFALDVLCDLEHGFYAKPRRLGWCLDLVLHKTC